jgi:hypothetical protein
LVEQSGRKFCAERIGLKRRQTVKTYRGIVKGNTVVLEEKLDVEDGTEALVLVKASGEEEREIIRRQKAMLDKGFAMGKLLYKGRGELHGRGK